MNRPLIAIFGMTLGLTLIQCKTDRKKTDSTPTQSKSTQTPTPKRSASEIASDIQAASATYQAQACDGANASSNPLCPAVSTLANTDTSALTSAIEIVSSDPSAVTDLTQTLQVTSNSDTDISSSTATSSTTDSTTDTNTETVSTNVPSKKPAWSNQQIVGMSFMVLGSVIILSGLNGLKKLKRDVKIYKTTSTFRHDLVSILKANPTQDTMVSKLHKAYEHKPLNSNEKVAYNEALSYAEKYDKLKGSHSSKIEQLTLHPFLDDTTILKSKIHPHLNTKLNENLKVTGVFMGKILQIIIGTIPLAVIGAPIYATGLAEGTTDPNPAYTYFNTLGKLANEALSQ